MEFTEEQLAEIEKLKREAVSKREEELRKIHNDEMASQRKKANEEKAKAVEEAKKTAQLSTEERLKLEAEEKAKADNERLAFLENEYKKSKITAKLNEAQVPTFFVNDSRLLNAKEEELDGVVKTIKEEFSKVMPSGANVNTNVNVGGSNTKTEREKKFEEFSKIK